MKFRQCLRVLALCGQYKVARVCCAECAARSLAPGPLRQFRRWGNDTPLRGAGAARFCAQRWPPGMQGTQSTHPQGSRNPEQRQPQAESYHSVGEYFGIFEHAGCYPEPRRQAAAGLGGFFG